MEICFFAIQTAKEGYLCCSNMERVIYATMDIAASFDEYLGVIYIPSIQFSGTDGNFICLAKYTIAALVKFSCEIFNSSTRQGVYLECWTIDKACHVSMKDLCH